MKKLGRLVGTLVVGATVLGGTARAGTRVETRLEPTWVEPARIERTLEEQRRDGKAGAGKPAPGTSVRMTRAKDLIADDQWAAAIIVLRDAVADPKEESRDEALFWLAHSQNRVGDFTSAVESVMRLQRDYTKSPWSSPANSLLIELAQKLGRRDVLWWTATTPPPPPSAPPAAPVAAPRRTPRPMPPAPAPAPPVVSGLTPPPPPPAPPAWIPEAFVPDSDARLLALGSLIETDAAKVIPLLRDIAYGRENPGVARRAVFVLAQSRNPVAQRAVVDVAKNGPDAVRVAAVRDLGLFGGAGIGKELLQVYHASADVVLKQQVVLSLGERADADALVQITESEKDVVILENAIIMLGRVGGRQPLRLMYLKARPRTRQAIIVSLCNARDDEGLIRIAEQEKDPVLRKEVLTQLRLLGTDQAKAYLAKSK